MRIQTIWRNMHGVGSVAAAALALAVVLGGGCGSTQSQSPGTGDAGTTCSGIDCSVLDDACNAGVCNPLDGKCARLPASDGTPCAGGHCASGACTSLTCESGSADCDGSASNGCEVNLAADPGNCGSCKNACAPAVNATATCASSSCGILCNAGFGNCDGNSATGCETSLTEASNCGACGNACAAGPNGTASCVNDTCSFECSAGFADCNGAGADGCETTTSSNPQHCGACGVVCPPGNACEQSSCSPLHRWSNRFGGTSGDAGHAIAFDTSGNVYVVGKFTGSVSFGGSTFSTSSYDAFIASYDGVTGAHRWSKQLGGSGNDEGMSVAVDTLGNVYVSGYFSGTANFGGGAVPSSGQDAFVASYEGATGNHRWSKGLGGTSSDAAAGVAVDATGDVYLTGYFSQTVNFGGLPLTSAGDTDIFVASYQGTAGAHRWSRRFGASTGDGGTSVATDVSGYVYATGYYFGTADFGGGALPSNGGADVFVARFDSATGTHVWSKHFGGSANDRPASVATDAAGNAYVAGLMQNSVDFGAGPVTSGGGYDGFVASYAAASGAYRWARTTGSVGTDEGRGVAVDTAGNVFLTGYFEQTADFGTGQLTSAGSTDLFVASYAGSTGVPRWAHRLGGSSTDDANGIAVDNAGGIGVTGSFQGSVDFGGGALTSSGAQDVYVLVLAD